VSLRGAKRRSNLVFIESVSAVGATPCGRPGILIPFALSMSKGAPTGFPLPTEGEGGGEGNSSSTDPVALAQSSCHAIKKLIAFAVAEECINICWLS